MGAAISRCDGESLPGTMRRYRQLQCALRQRAPGSPTLAHSALRQHPLLTKTLSITAFVGNVYFFFFLIFHENLSSPQSRSSRQPAQWGRERENAYHVKKTKTAKKHPHPGPSPQRSMCKETRFLNYFITIIIIFLQASNSSFPIIHNCVSRWGRRLVVWILGDKRAALICSVNIFLLVSLYFP